MIGFCPLGSGSKGNCIYFGSPQAKILIDAGMSAKAICLKLGEIGVAIEDIDAILITHEHSDHITGLKVLAFKYNIPIFANAETAKGIVDFLQECPKFKIFSTGEPFEFRDLHIHPFSIQHDTLDPVGFILRLDQLKVGFCADVGFISTLVRNHLQHCDYLYVEANHQPSMVHACSRPMVYKQRVLSRTGHLSNEDCGKLLADVAHDGLKQVFLAHLSSECNTPDVAKNVVEDILAKYSMKLNLSIAHQAKVSDKVLF